MEHAAAIVRPWGGTLLFLVKRLTAQISARAPGCQQANANVLNDAKASTLATGHLMRSGALHVFVR